MNKPKNQHYLPAVYLRGFCDESGKLHLYDFVKKEFRSNIKPEEVAKKNHIYTITHNGVKDYYIENFFSEIETQYGALITRIENSRIEQLTENDVEEIIWFISFLYARNLSKIKIFSEESQKSLSFMGNNLINYNLQQQGEEYLRPFIQIEPNKDYVQKWAMYTMYIVAERMFHLLINEGKWSFYLAQETSEFITTDDPMENMVMIPLSKKFLFMRVTEQIYGIDKRIMHVAPDWVNYINCKIASSAKRFIFARSRKIIKKII
jgi:hypothetical protein